jgi:hypothetical protein
MRKSIKTKASEIVQYWEVNTSECGLGVDFAEAHERCWRCGYKLPLERCHIIPASLGGEDTPSNYVLLVANVIVKLRMSLILTLCGFGYEVHVYLFMILIGIGVLS